MTRSGEVRTAAATAAVRRRGQETKAAALREAGWLVIAPEDVERLPAELLRRLAAFSDGGRL